MARKKKAQPGIPDSAPEAEVFDPFVGADLDDDLSDMEYVQDENTASRTETMPPSTKEEAELRKQVEPDPTPVEEDDKGDEVEAKDEPEEVKADESAADPEVVAEDEAVEAEAEEGTPEEPQIPKHRFDEISDRLKAAEDKTADLERQLEAKVEAPAPEPEPEPYDYASKNKEAVDAILEGDSDKYIAIQDEIRAQTKAEALAEAKQIADAGDQGTIEQRDFEAAGAAIEAAHPELSAQSENYNQTAREDLIDLYLGYANSGKYTRADALKKAAEKTVAIYGLGAEEIADDTTPDNVVTLKPADPKKKADVANAQPPVMEGKGDGVDEPKLDLTSMSDEEFDSLPEATKRKARGDVL